MIERKLFEKVDDNPGDYFGMLVESVEDDYMKHADADARKVKSLYRKNKDIGSVFSSLGYTDNGDGSYEKEVEDNIFIVFEYDEDSERLEYKVVNEETRTGTPSNVLKLSKKSKNESITEDSEYKTLAKLSNGLEVISYPYGYAVSDGYAADRFVVRDGKYIFDDGRFSLSDKDKEKILSLIKKGVIEESLKESYSKSDLYSALEYMYGFNKKEANDWIKKASDKMKQSVVDGWKGNAKKSALTDSLKEDKYFIVKSFYDGPHGFYGVIEDTSVIDNNGEYKKYRFNDREELKKFASELVSKGYKNQQGYTKDALLKEDKFVSRDKKELNEMYGYSELSFKKDEKEVNEIFDRYYDDIVNSILEGTDNSEWNGDYYRDSGELGDTYLWEFSMGPVPNHINPDYVKELAVEENGFEIDHGSVLVDEEDNEYVPWHIHLYRKNPIKEKFVPRDKMSKKDKKELDNKKRNTWGSTNPVTRVQPNKKAYDRKRDKKELKENKSTKSKKLVEDLHTEKQIKLLQSRLSDFRKSWINLRDTLEYVDYEVASSIDDGYPFEMSFDELSLEVTDWLEDCIARCDWLYDEAQNGRFGNLTEDKFVPQDKMSKKAQKQI